MNETTAPIVIDIEASGPGEGSYPIEIGLVLPDGAAHCYLILPYAEWTQWDEEAERLHGLKRETVVRFGMDGGYVARQLNKRLAEKTVYSDSSENHNAWLGLLFRYAGLVPQFELESLRAITSEAQQARWDSTREQVINESGLKRHRASADARIMQSTWLRTLHTSGMSATQSVRE